MKKGIILILLIVFAVLFNAQTVFAYVFGGEIINTKAIEVATLEASGYICSSLGTSISILPIGSPVGTPISYFIPHYITSKTRTITKIGQEILGIYSMSQTIIPCILPGDPPLITTVSLPTIFLFGTSIW